MATITVPRCQRCRKQHVEALVVSDDQVEAYRRGSLIQEAFPSLTQEEREMLITGMNQECWDKAMEAFK